MSNIAEPVRTRVLERPKRFAALRNFSCGRKGNEWESSVNKWARALYLGTEAQTQAVVVAEDASRKLIGLCSFIDFPFDVPNGGMFSDAVRIHMLGTDRLFRGELLADGSRPGDVVLRGAIDHIEHDRGVLPFLSALVAPGNEPSLALFRRNNFSELPYAGIGEVILIRSPPARLRAGRLRLLGALRSTR